MTKSTTVCLPIVVGFCFLAGAYPEQAKAQWGKEALVLPAEEIQWADNPAVKGAKIVVLWGNPKTGAYGALKTAPASEVSTLGNPGEDVDVVNVAVTHIHTYDQRVIVLSGTFVFSVGDSAPRELGRVLTHSSRAA